jgi:transposase
MGDKACSSAANRSYLRKRGIKAVIPVKEDQKNHRRNRGSQGGRPPAFDAEQYKERNTAGRCSGKLKQFRAVATLAVSRAVRSGLSAGGRTRFPGRCRPGRAAGW